MKPSEKVPCDQVIARLWEFVDGDLEDERRERIEAHLDVCARCFPEYDFRRAYLRFVQRTATQSIPPVIRQRVFQAILEEERRGTMADRGDLPGGLLGRLRRLFRRDRDA